jgi:predicted Zn-dependent peptidase
LPGISVTDARYAAAEVLVAALGGGMSSRLFQSVREERGKAYSVYAFLSPYRDIGYTGVYAATGGADVEEVLDLVFQELTAIKQQGLDPGELARTREQIAGACLLSLESMESRMGRIARNQLYFGREIAVDEVVAEVRAVSNQQVMEIALDILSTDRAGLALVGDAGVGTVSLPLP